MTTTLDDMSKLVNHMVDSEEAVKKAEELLKEAKARLARIKEETIPSAMQELGIQSYTLDTGQTLTLNQQVYASIPKHMKGQCYKWLDDNGFGGLIKTEVALQFSKDEREAATEYYENLVRQGLKPDYEMGIHSATLKAFIKEQLAKGEEFPLDMFGARAVFEAKISKK